MARETIDLSIRLRVVRETPDPIGADDFDPPTLTGMRVVNTTGESVPPPRPLAKCGPVATAGAERRKAGSK
jgi:hypothetical protein